MGNKKRRHKAPTCPYCGSQAVCRDSSTVYGKSYGRVWVCARYPECDSYVGCHRGSRQPLGRMANKELRALKRKVHSAFDSLWKSGVMKRTQAYKWLADELKIPQWSCHIGMFDKETCEEALRICKNSPDKRIERFVELKGATQ